MRSILVLALAAASSVALAQTTSRDQFDPKVTEFYDLKPEKITPGASNSDAPSDAIVLFNGKDFNEWTSAKEGGAPKWDLKDGAMTVAKGTGDVKTKKEFRDFQLHIEWRTPSEVIGEGQGRGNSGIFLQGLYELQVLDSYESVTYSNGQAGSIYKQEQAVPLVNACKKPGEWQTYDVLFTAARFGKGGRMIVPAFVTVFHNGVVIQAHTAITGPTEYKGLPVYKEIDKGPLQLQDHGNPVSYRNIWIREL
ncbi:MAG: DUF1080 domain-containing protein [Bacteroidota bacterium]